MEQTEAALLCEDGPVAAIDAHPLPGILEQLQIKLASLPDLQNEAQKIKELQERLATERLHLAVVGQFKRGKSTLLNALLGSEILPTSVIPLTAIPTFLYGEATIKARVQFLDKRPGQEFATDDAGELNRFLAGFVTEAENPKNSKMVSQVEVFFPSPFLQQGIVLIDTPGIGSTFLHNTEMTLNFLPQCDAAFFVVSADPPITEVEVDFLKAVKAKMTRLFVVVNKIDYLNTAEKETFINFLREVLSKQAGLTKDIPIFCLSARQGIEAKQSGNLELWRASGMQELEGYMLNFLARDKNQALYEAVAKKAQDLVADIVLRLQLFSTSLKMPLAELDHRLEVFAQKLEEVERQRILVSDLLAGDKKRMVVFLEEQAEELRQKAKTYLLGIMNNLEHPDELNMQQELENCLPLFFERELNQTSKVFNQRITEVLGTYQQKADELVGVIRETAAELFDIPYHAPKSSEVFAANRQPYWVTQKWESSLAQLPKDLFFKFAPARIKHSIIAKQLTKQIEALVLHNVENLRWATLQNVNQAFLRFSSGLEDLLQATIAATQGAIKAARARRLEHSDAIALEIEKIQLLSADFAKTKTELEKIYHKPS